jgi:hypothetical protein
MEYELKDYIGSLSANTTYVVSENCAVSGTVNFPAGVTLIFKGGKITGSGTFNGVSTALVAPIMQIFDTTVNVTGLWCMDRAYPQWFGAKAYKNNSDMQSGVDSSDAINKAINMKLTGEVFLPRGVYKVSNTVKVRCSIILTGEPGMYDSSDTDSTILVASTGGNFTNGGTDKYFIRVNVQEGNDSNWAVEYPAPGTEIKHLFFRNIFNVSDLRRFFMIHYLIRTLNLQACKDSRTLKKKCIRPVRQGS